MKKYLRIIGIALISCIMVSFCIPKGGPDLETFINSHEQINKSNSSYEILVDFSKPSCEDRLFIYDVSHDQKLVYSGVVLHGCGGASTPSKPEFSNEIGSHCSSLGEYTLEGLVTMKNGKEAIKLKGWSDTNSNAEERGIYIHTSIMATMLPFNLPNANFPLTKASEGCFAVSHHTYHAIKKYMEIDKDANCKTTLIAYYGE
ncbi:MAG: murein L,D-transpeptidase catalytic domain family protein [Prevotella sp.]|nr:murein L,D-transpeptidase catalytic domain family protein [Prevotella sp.]